MLNIKDFQHVTVTVGDAAHALDFYCGLLGFRHLGRYSTHNSRGLVLDYVDIGNHYLLELFSYQPGLAQPTQRQIDDRQVGPRHIAFKVNSVDTITARLKAAGVEYTLDPIDAVGGVRIAFFKDPWGTVYETVEGSLEYHVPGDQTGFSNQPEGDTLVYDHLTLTVADIEKSLHFYREGLGFPRLGRLVFHNEQGFVIDYLQAGKAVIELFSYSVPILPFHWDPDDAFCGMRHFGLLVENVDQAAETLKTQGTPILDPPDDFDGVRICFFADPDGNPIELIDGIVHYDEN